MRRGSPAARSGRASSRPAAAWLETQRRAGHDLPFNFVLVCPLLLVYEVGILWLGAPVRNGADLLLRRGFEALSERGFLLFNAVLALALGLSLVRVSRVGPRLVPAGPLLMAEGLLCALLLGPVVQWVGDQLGAALSAARDPGRDLALSAVLAVGAGVYEELVFRLLLMRGTLWLLRRVGGMHGIAAGVVAVAVSSLVFALFHHVGPGAEPFTSEAFAFRSLAGLLLAGLFAFRGLAVAVYAHAFYDLMLL